LVQNKELSIVIVNISGFERFVDADKTINKIKRKGEDIYE